MDKNKIFYEKVAKNGWFPLYFGPKQRSVATHIVVKKINFNLIFCLLRSIVSHMQSDKIQIRKSFNSEHLILNFCFPGWGPNSIITNNSI